MSRLLLSLIIDSVCARVLPHDISGSDRERGRKRSLRQWNFLMQKRKVASNLHFKGWVGGVFDVDSPTGDLSKHPNSGLKFFMCDVFGWQANGC